MKNKTELIVAIICFAMLYVANILLGICGRG